MREPTEATAQVPKVLDSDGERNPILKRGIS